MRLLHCLSSAGCFILGSSILLTTGAGYTQDDKDVKTAPESKKDAGAPVKAGPVKSGAAKGSLDQEMLRGAAVPTDPPALLKFFQSRTLPESERPGIQSLIKQLGSADYRIRNRAAMTLTARGPAVLEALRTTRVVPHDAELVRRIERLCQQIPQNDISAEVCAAAVRVLAAKKPAGYVPALVAYLPFAQNDAVAEEIRYALSQDAKPDPSLLAALTDRAPIRRAVAAEAIGRCAYAEHKEALRKLLQDPDAGVRRRVAQTLIYAREKTPVPTLIDTLPDLPLNAAWQTEDFLMRLAAGTTLPTVPMGNDKKAREQCRDAWQTWWKTHGDKVDLVKFAEPPRPLGRTLVILLDLGRVTELNPDNSPRWQINNLRFPLDAQLVGDDRLLTAEYHANLVAERNTRGEILWQTNIAGPLIAQRLPNGNTFIATDSGFIEYAKDGKEIVLNVSVSDEGRKIMKAMKTPAGDIVCMQADARIVRYDPTGRELSSFPISIGIRLFGGRIHVLDNGRILVPHNAENKIVEYDREGKAVWEIPFDQPIAAVRLPNGNTLITSMDPSVGAVEVDRTGAEVWTYRELTRVTRALRR
jgi:hypothetical protein